MTHRLSALRLPLLRRLLARRRHLSWLAHWGVFLSFQGAHTLSFQRSLTGLTGFGFNRLLLLPAAALAKRFSTILYATH